MVSRGTLANIHILCHRMEGCRNMYIRHGSLLSRSSSNDRAPWKPILAEGVMSCRATTSLAHASERECAKIAEAGVGALAAAMQAHEGNVLTQQRASGTLLSPLSLPFEERTIRRKR